MPEFILPRDGTAGNPPVTFDSLDAFTQGYIEALFFTSCSPAFDRDDIASDPAAWETARAEGQSDGEIPGDAGFSDLTPAALESIIADCEAFQRENVVALANCQMTKEEREELAEYGHGPGWNADGDNATELGRDYWYTRNGHGCGYWDGDWPAPWGEILANAARYSEVNVYWTDAGQVDL